jgi:hypothetical protein
VTKNAEVRLFIWFGATVGLALVLAACGRDGYVVVREAKTPHRAFDLPTFSGLPTEPPTPPLPIVPIQNVPMSVVPGLVPNALDLRPVRRRKPIAGVATLSATFADRTGDRTSAFPEGSAKDCAIFKSPGDSAAQKTLLYAHFASEGRELRLALDMTLYEGRTPLVDLERLGRPFTLASLELRPVLRGRSSLVAKDDAVDAEGPPMWPMDLSLGAGKLDAACRAQATIRRDGGEPEIDLSLRCGKVAAEESAPSVDSLAVSVRCTARETSNVPFFAVAPEGAGK